MNLFANQKQPHKPRKKTPYGYQKRKGGRGRDKLRVWD